MTNRPVSKAGFALAIVAALVLGACANSDSEADHGETGTEGGHANASHSSSAGLPEGHASAGEQLSAAKGEATGQSCVDCHGAEGNAPIDPTYPRLAGQYADYLEHALQAYRSGDRPHALMSSQAKSLTDQQIADLGAYFSSRQGQLTDLKGAHDRN